MGFNQCSNSLLRKNGKKKCNLHKSNDIVTVTKSVNDIGCNRNLAKKVLVMGVLSSFPYKSNNKCSEEEGEEDVRVFGLPYLQMLQRGRRDGNEENVIAS